MNFGHFYDVWLPRAERWLENERTSTIRCVIAFAPNSASTCPLTLLPPELGEGSDWSEAIGSEVYEGLIQGKIEGWEQFFNLADDWIRREVRIGRGITLSQPIPNLCLTAAWLLNSDLMHELTKQFKDGRWFNLKGCVSVTASDGESIPGEFRFPVFQNRNTELGQVLEASFEAHGGFAVIDDLRAVVVEVLRSLMLNSVKAQERAESQKGKGGRPRGAKLSKYEQECIRLYLQGVKPSEIDTTMLSRLGARRASGEAWDHNSALAVVRAAKQRGDIPVNKRQN